MAVSKHKGATEGVSNSDPLVRVRLNLRVNLRQAKLREVPGPPPHRRVERLASGVSVLTASRTTCVNVGRSACLWTFTTKWSTT